MSAVNDYPVVQFERPIDEHLLEPTIYDEYAEILANDDGSSWRDELPEDKRWGWNDDIQVANELQEMRDDDKNTWTIGGETLPNPPGWSESLSDAGFGSSGPM